MRLWDKLDIWFSMKNCTYNENVDRFVRSVIQNGSVVGRNPWYVIVELNDTKFHFWAENRWYADLSDCKDDNGDYVYRDLRPSRLTEIMFWEWLESNGVTVCEKTEEERADCRITEILKEDGLENSGHPKNS